jgi:hypothetical protein
MSAISPTLEKKIDDFVDEQFPPTRTTPSAPTPPPPKPYNWNFRRKRVWYGQGLPNEDLIPMPFDEETYLEYGVPLPVKREKRHDAMLPPPTPIKREKQDDAMLPPPTHIKREKQDDAAPPPPPTLVLCEQWNCENWAVVDDPHTWQCELCAASCRSIGSRIKAQESTEKSAQTQAPTTPRASASTQSP